MPQSAIDAEVADYIISPGEIPVQLKELVNTAKIVPSDFTVSKELNEDEIFKQILSLIKVKHGIDFTYYKQTTIRRRILRRRVLNRIQNIREYLIFLLENKGEQDALLKDLLIPVTSFFRDSATFDVLCEKVFPLLIKEKKGGGPLRIWIAGCSTGEEAYSIAICLHEFLKDRTPLNNVQIFATDISEAVIQKARSGIYQKRDVAGVSENRIQQYFTKVEGRYQVNKDIRGMCVFACQNFIYDPPFARMDLISCRNALIYMESYLQTRALNNFYYALNTKGYLLLGKSESTNHSSKQFQAFSQHHRIYTRKESAGRNVYVPTERNAGSVTRKNENKSIEVKNDNFQKAADEALLSKFAAVGVIINEQLDILQFRGSTAPYLEAAPGKASHNILKMAREGLAFELRNALHKASLSNEAVKKEGIAVEKGTRKVNIEIIPLANTIEPYFLVLFSEFEEKLIKKDEKVLDKEEVVKQNSDLLRIEHLEKELAQVRQDMHAITEDQEAAYEELQSANEELKSGNEELQSLYEELETSKEEIQSTNEELITLNQELIERNEQLIYSRKYAEAIVTTIHEPFLILTRDLRIKNANKSFYEMFGATEQQTEGKPFFEWFGGIWNIPGLQEKLYKILPGHTDLDNFEVCIGSQLEKEKYLTLNARQLINENSDEQLILLAIHDITVTKEFEKSQNLFAQKLEQQVRDQTKELKEANIQLHNSNEDLQQFASIASHDLQEPLRKIKTFTSVFITKFDNDISDEGKNIINKIKRSADRMSDLIREVLEFSKLTNATREFVQIDLDVILRKVLQDLDMLISDNNASIDYRKALPTIEAIPLQINQLFYNLLTNAFKFYKKDTPPQLIISWSTLSSGEEKKISGLREGPSYIEIKFSDNGIGFEQQFADQIFQIFERLHTINDFEGTGIGLALCKKIVENHHGQIFALSEENKGATFHIILPLKQN
jgi:two-component system CheB/CheR fusion protein